MERNSGASLSLAAESWCVSPPGPYMLLASHRSTQAKSFKEGAVWGHQFP